MGVVIETGYTLPNGDEPLTHARILHDRNRARMATVTGGTGTLGEATDNGLTYEKWTCDLNRLSDPTDFSQSSWTKTNSSIAGDGQTFNEGVAAGVEHLVQQNYAFSATSYNLAFKVETETITGVRVLANDGTTTYSANFNLITGTVDGTTNANSAKVSEVSPGVYWLLVRFTCAAGSGVVRIQGLNAALSSAVYTGTSRTMKILEASLTRQNASVDYYSFGSVECDACCIGGHNLGTTGARVIVQHDSDEDDTYTTIVSYDPTTDEPLFFIFEPVTSGRWRIVVQNGASSEVAVVWWGKALQMERPLYGEYTPPNFARATEVRSSYSESGEFLGRTKQRTYLEFNINWSLLSRSWVDTNWYPALKAMESEPFFLAPIPSVHGDVSLCQTTQSPAAPTQQANGYVSASLPLRALGYD